MSCSSPALWTRCQLLDSLYTKWTVWAVNWNLAEILHLPTVLTCRWPRRWPVCIVLWFQPDCPGHHGTLQDDAPAGCWCISLDCWFSPRCVWSHREVYRGKIWSRWVMFQYPLCVDAFVLRVPANPVYWNGMFYYYRWDIPQIQPCIVLSELIVMVTSRHILITKLRSLADQVINGIISFMSVLMVGFILEWNGRTPCHV